MKLSSISDYLEQTIADRLTELGILFIHDSQGGTKGLDFYLPNHDIYIEVKQFSAPRSKEQLERADNIILIQGVKALDFFTTNFTHTNQQKLNQMIEVGKYYKFTDNELVVKALSPENEGTFYGEVVVAAKGYDDKLWCDVAYFIQCEPPQVEAKKQFEAPDAMWKSLSDILPTKDVELRLECLKLAVEQNKGIGSHVSIMERAQEYYGWITKEDKAV